MARRSGRGIRSTDIGIFLEIFIVCAVLTVLLARFLATMRGASAIEIGPLHITHILWSGPIMLIALIVMQSFVTRAAQLFGAIVGGVGFGLFIDNFGQYITDSHNYFFKPSFAIIYATFIGIYLTVRFSLLRRSLTPHECLVNAVDFAKEAAAGGLDRRQRREAHDLMARADSSHELYQPVQALFEKIDSLPPRKPYFWDRWLREGLSFYSKWATTKLFKWIVLSCFMLIGIYVLYEIVHIFKILLHHEHRTIHHWIVFIAYFFSMKSFLVGDIRLMRGKRLSAYRWFNEGLLVWLLVVQVFVFLKAPLKGIVILFVLLLLLGAIRYMIAEEKSLEAYVSKSPAQQILARFDRIPVWPWPRKLLGVVGFGFFFAFFDIVTIGFALPVIIKQFHVTADAATWAITSSLIGYIVGSFLDSRLNDRFGRKVGLYISVSLFAFGSLLSATSPNLGWLIFWRVISGMGIGAEIAAVTTYMGELSPAAIRGRYTGWAISAGFLGFAVVPFAALELVPNYAWGWRALFVIGAVGGIVLLFMRRHMPQSPHWLLSQGKTEEAAATVGLAETIAKQKLLGGLPPVPETIEANAEAKGSFIDLFRSPYLGRLILFAVIWFSYYIGNYAWLTLAPELLAKHGISLKNSIAFLSVTGIGFVAGSVIAALVSDRMERKLSTALICLVWTACLLIIGFFPSKLTIMIVGFLASTSIGLVIPILYAYTAENFSTPFRATGVSVTDGLGHLGGAFCGQIVFAVYHPYGFSGAFVAMAATGLIAALLLSFGIKATGRSLHHL